MRLNGVPVVRLVVVPINSPSIEPRF